MVDNNKPKITKKHKDLGIFYTDQAIVDFIYSITEVWKQKEDDENNKWLKHKPKPNYPSVIDPAVGEGIFLKEALNRGFTDKHRVFGLDIDSDVVKSWKKIHLLKAFGGNEKDLEAHFFHQNGLDCIQWQQHIGKYRYKLNQEDIRNQQFDLVIGNPPYGGTGLDINEAPDSLIEQLRGFELLGDLRYQIGSGNTDQISIFDKYTAKFEHVDIKITSKIKSFPIENLFLERFIQLAKPGGWIAIILPEGILANSNSSNMRKYIEKYTKVEAIVSLPREAFKSVGTNAKTSILFLRKYSKRPIKLLDYPVFMADIGIIDEYYFSNITQCYKEYYGGTMKDLIKSIKDKNGNDRVMVRADKSLKELMEEKPASRWDVKYWLPKFDEVMHQIYDSGLPVKPLSSFIEEIAQGDVPRKKLGEKFVDKGVRFIEVENIKYTGIDFYNSRYITEKQFDRLSRVSLTKNSILIVRSGATIGKIVAVTNVYERAVVNGHINKIVCREINPYYVVVFMKSRYGQLQLERLQRGVAQPELNFDEIGAVMIPIIDPKQQSEIEKEYREVALIHDGAILLEESNPVMFKSKILDAEKKLRDLVSQLETMISKK